MESLGQYIDMKAIRAMAKKNGVNVDDPELGQKVSDYRRNTHNEWVGAVHKSKADHYASLSLFDGGQKLSGIRAYRRIRPKQQRLLGRSTL